MFYDDAFKEITEHSPFSTEGKIALDNKECIIRGMFCAGAYGEVEADKGYTLRKTEKRQSFKVSQKSLPSIWKLSDYMRKVITIDGKAWMISNIVGNDSGIVAFELKPTTTREQSWQR